MDAGLKVNWATQFLTVAYDGAHSLNVCQNGANFLRCLALQTNKQTKKEEEEKERNLMTAYVSMLLKLHTSPDMLPFSLCNKKRPAIWHKNRPLFPTTLFIPS
jgi:hypothetical protein